MSPTLVLMPGLHGTGDLFGPLRAEIPSEYRVRGIEYPTERARSIRQLSEQIERELAGEGDLVLIAESFSGALALRFANAHPGRVRAVVLCVSFVLPPVPRVFCYLATPCIWFRCPIFSVAIRTFLSGFRAEGELVREVRRAVRRNGVLALASRVRQMAWVDAREDLKNCAVPILCVGAGRDRLVGRRSVRRMLRVRGELMVKVVDGPHLLLQVRAREVWGEIEGFLGGVVTPSLVEHAEA